MGHDTLPEFVELNIFPGENTASVAILSSACLCPVPTEGPQAAILSIHPPLVPEPRG